MLSFTERVCVCVLVREEFENLRGVVAALVIVKVGSIRGARALLRAPGVTEPRGADAVRGKPLPREESLQLGAPTHFPSFGFHRCSPFFPFPISPVPSILFLLSFYTHLPRSLYEIDKAL